jgi:hypothetical protein
MFSHSCTLNFSLTSGVQVQLARRRRANYTRVSLLAPQVALCNTLCIYDILGKEHLQGAHPEAGGKPSSSLRLHNDVHQVSNTASV